MTFLIFVLVLSILIVVHEAGHFLMARKQGVHVEQFALGFGPKIFSRISGGTEYCLCAIPLGGYVKMAGDDRTQSKGASDEYFSKSIGARSWIVLMGPAVNYLLAYVCFVAVFMLGYVDMEATNKAVPAVVGKVMASSPAEQAGLKGGEEILTVNGEAVASWSAMQEKIASSGEKALVLTFSRSGESLTASIVPERHKTKDLFGREREVSRIGIQPAQISSADDLVVRRYGFFAAWGKAAEELWNITARTYQALWQIVTGQRSAKEGMTGLIGIFFVIKFALAVGFSFLLHVVGVISASLAIFNLLPIIPLDGGHLLLNAIEKVRGRALSLKADEVMAKIGFGLIIALAVFVFYADFERIGLIDRVVHLLKG